MRYLVQHIHAIIASYTCDTPLAHFLKSYYKQHPILGSRDRKILSGLAYSWYRAAHALEGEEWINRLATQWINDPAQFTHFQLNEWLHKENITIDIQKLLATNVELSGGIKKEDWLQSMLSQPDLFIRTRKNKDKITRLLTEQQIPFTVISDTCLALPNGAKIDGLLPADTYAVQDASSQKTGTFFNPKKDEQWYDCCSGAGGKSLLLKDLEPGVKLTVSDKRERIIYNLQQRFKLYRQELPTAYITDVANEELLAKALYGKEFDNIICDAPCSGSGTWARTPEQLHFFNASAIGEFSSLQKSIAINVARYLRKGGRLIYITCSIFLRENENVVSGIVSETGLKLVKQQIINGIGIKADSMFIAVLSAS